MIERAEREPREPSKEILDYISPAFPADPKKNRPGSIREFIKMIIDDIREDEKEDDKKPSVVAVIGKPLSTKTTTIRSLLAEIEDNIEVDEKIDPLEWGHVLRRQNRAQKKVTSRDDEGESYKSKDLSPSEELASASRLQRWTLANLIEEFQGKRVVIPNESPATTSFPADYEIITKDDRGLTTIMSASRREWPFFSGRKGDKPYNYRLYLLGLVAKPDLERDMLETRGEISRLTREPDFVSSPKYVELIREILKKKGIDTLAMSDDKIRLYGIECASTQAIIGIDKQTDKLIGELHNLRLLKFDQGRYNEDPSYRPFVLARFMSELFDRIGPNDGVFVGIVSRAEELKVRRIDPFRIQSPLLTYR